MKYNIYMKKWLIGICFIVGVSLGGISDGAVVSTTVAPQGECPIGSGICGVVFPLSASILCDGSAGNLNCPQFFHPDWTTSTRIFGITNRVNPGLCVVSTDGGETFNTCTTQPFTAAVLNFGIKMAVASDGSLLYTSGQGTDLCIIRRSTDQGTSWSTVFTSTTEDCSIVTTSPTPPGMYCSQSGGYCAIIDMSNAAELTIIFSSDNGVTWTVGTPFAYTTANISTWGPALTDDGTDGILIRGTNASGAGEPFGIQSGSDYIATALFAAPVNLNCRPLMMGTTKRALCAPNAGGALFRFVDGTIPTVIREITIPDVLASANEPLVVGWSSEIGYLLVPSGANPSTRLNVYITGDSWASVVSLGQLIPTTSLSLGCCRGNTIRWQGKAYFSTGVSGANAFLAVIQ